jgi:hypothetical protein
MPGLSGLAERLPLRRPLVRDAGVVLAWFLVLAVVGALVWWQLTPLAEYTRTADNAQMSEEELGRQVAADGWYVVIAAVGGLLSGIGLLSWRRRDPVAMVVLVVLGSLIGGWVMLRVGLWLGPPDPKTVLANAAVGTRVPLQLEPKAGGVLYVWPIMTLVGAIGVIWGTDDVRAAKAESIDAAPVGEAGADDRADGDQDSEDGVGVPGSR